MAAQWLPTKRLLAAYQQRQLMDDSPSSDQPGLPWLAEDIRPDRLMSLEQALSSFVLPDSSVYIATDVQAAVRGIARQFALSGAGLTVICLRAGASHVGELLHAGLVKKLIAASFGVQFPAFQPCPLVQRRYQAGDTQFESWSLFSLVQRLMAGAMGIPFFPTRSLVGSAMTAHADYATLPSPFSGESVAVVSALTPDVTIAHALAADTAGNAIVVPPFEDDLWSTRAATKGVIVLAENIVPTAFLRQHANLVRIPAAKVIAVCHTPYAAHPEGYESGLDLDLPITRYARDITHYQDYARAARDDGAFRQWAKEWITGIESHAAYVSRLDLDRTGTGNSAESRKPPSLAQVYSRYTERMAEPWTPVDMMIVATARMVRDLVMSKNYKTMLVGAGNCRTAGALAYYLLKKAGCALTLVEGTGRVGYEPLPIANANRLTSTMLTGTVDAYGTLVGGHQNQCLALLGSGEIDVFGNMNSTFSHGTFLVGSGGSNDAVSLAAETLVMMRQSARRMVPRVECVTSPGSRVTQLISEQGIYGKDADGRFLLQGYFAYDGIRTADEATRAIQEKCGWPIRTGNLHSIAPPSDEELSILRWLTGTPSP